MAPPNQILESASPRRRSKTIFSLFILFSGILIFAALAAALLVVFRPVSLRIAVGPAG
jgi:hypothetical protein